MLAQLRDGACVTGRFPRHDLLNTLSAQRQRPNTCRRRPITAQASAASAAPISQPGKAPWTKGYASAAEVDAMLTAVRAGGKQLPIVLYFTATWCGPCKLVSREVDKLRLQYMERVNILTVDIDTEKDLAVQMGVQSVPTVMFVGHADPSTPAIMTQGNVTSKLMADVLDTKIHLAGADLLKPRRLF